VTETIPNERTRAMRRIVNDYVRRGDFVRYMGPDGPSGALVTSVSLLYRLTGGRAGSIRVVPYPHSRRVRLRSRSDIWSRCTPQEAYPELTRLLMAALDDAIDREGTGTGPDSLPREEEGGRHG